MPTLRCPGGSPATDALIGESVGSVNGSPLAYNLNGHQKVASTRRLRGLSDRQRAALLDRFSAH